MRTTVPPADAPPTRSFLAALARAYWVLLGNIPPILLAMGVAQGPPRPGILDAAFWCAAATLVLVRYADVVHLGGTTAQGQRATLQDWRRYAVVVALASAAAWTVARVASSVLAS